LQYTLPLLNLYRPQDFPPGQILSAMLDAIGAAFLRGIAFAW
jgi:hypothetical protein